MFSYKYELLENMPSKTTVSKIKEAENMNITHKLYIKSSEIFNDINTFLNQYTDILKETITKLQTLYNKTVPILSKKMNQKTSYTSTQIIYVT